MVDLQAPAAVYGYRPQDRPYLIDIDTKGCDWAWTYREWSQHIGLNPIFVARSFGHITGFLVADCSFRPVAEVVKLVVDRRYRRLGIGTRLMNHFIAEAAACDFTKVTTTVPEYYLDPRAEKDVSRFISQWFKPNGVAREAFDVEGQIMDGVKFAVEL